ncbi:MAG: hypothetical protein JWM47_204 [Acidimicrobiales bacterium]|nr:hypothetical protein [Acidimicrobiales bacterium]
MNARALVASAALFLLVVLGSADAASANLEPPGPCPPESPNMPEWCQPPPPDGPGEPKPSRGRPTRLTIHLPDDPDVG